MSQKETKYRTSKGSFFEHLIADDVPENRSPWPGWGELDNCHPLLQPLLQDSLSYLVHSVGTQGTGTVSLIWPTVWEHKAPPVSWTRPPSCPRALVPAASSTSQVTSHPRGIRTVWKRWPGPHTLKHEIFSLQMMSYSWCKELSAPLVEMIICMILYYV